MKVPTAAAIAEMICLNPDVDTIVVGDNTYERCLERPREELQRWLYSVIHVGNQKIFENTDLQNANLNSEITSSLTDPWFEVEVAEQATVNGIEVAEVGGIKIKKTITDSLSGVRIPCFRPNLTPGFFMFKHDDSIVNNDEAKIMRYYVSTNSPELAISVWSKAIKYLLRSERKFSAKVLSNSESYPRNDAVVFYLPGKNPAFEKRLVEIVQDEPDKDESCMGSPLCQSISSQITLAQQPRQSGNEEVSFGEHRCRIIAKAIQDALSTGADFLPLLIARLKQEHVNPQNLSANAY